MPRNKTWPEHVNRMLRLYLPPSLATALNGPARHALTRSHSGPMGLFASSKMTMMVPWESTLERDYLFLIEADPAVIGFIAQPVRLDLLIDGRKRRHYPDFLVVGLDSSVWISEVKDDREAQLPEVQAMFAAARTACGRWGIEYKVILRSHIRNDLSLSMAKIAVRDQSQSQDRCESMSNLS